MHAPKLSLPLAFVAATVALPTAAEEQNNVAIINNASFFEVETIKKRRGGAAFVSSVKLNGCKQPADRSKNCENSSITSAWLYSADCSQDLSKEGAIYLAGKSMEGVAFAEDGEAELDSALKTAKKECEAAKATYEAAL